MKTCRKCQVEKDFSEFHKNEKNKDGHQSYCIPCYREFGRNYAASRRKLEITFDDITDDVKERFFAKVEKTDYCWNWSSARTSYRKNRPVGYGYFSVKGRPFYVHRLSYLMHNGSLVDGLVIDHLCNNTLCVNPEHLKQTTNYENVTRSKNFSGNKDYTHCKNGHLRTPDMKGKVCSVCWSKERRSEYNRQRYLKRKTTSQD